MRVHILCFNGVEYRVKRLYLTNFPTTTIIIIIYSLFISLYIFKLQIVKFSNFNLEAKSCEYASFYMIHHILLSISSLRSNKDNFYAVLWVVLTTLQSAHIEFM